MRQTLNLLTHEGTFRDHDDGTLKSVYSRGKEILEVTFIQNKSYKGIDVFCVPTHHYCNLGCTLCHLTQEGSQVSMKPVYCDDFIEGLFRTTYTKSKGAFLADYDVKFDDGATGEKRSKNKKCLVSYMGVGEPLLNLDLVRSVFEYETILKRICDYDVFGYALATMMPNRNMSELTSFVKEVQLPLKVHFSLHSPFSDERRALLPKTRVDVDEALELVCKYRQEIAGIASISENFRLIHTNEDPTEIHYTLIRGINDSDKHLQKMSNLLKKHRIPFKLLKFNAPKGMERSEKEKHWLKVLREEIPDLSIREYSPPGKAIGSSCGEFTKHYYLSALETEVEKQEFMEWKRKHQIFE